MEKRNCPHCGEKVYFSIHLKPGQGNAKPKKKERPYAKDQMDDIVKHYLKVKGITDKVAIKNNWGRIAKVAKKFLMNTGGDVGLIKKKISGAKEYFESKDLEWKIEAVSRHWQNIDNNHKDGYVGGW